MLSLGNSLGIGVLTITFSSMSFAGAGQTGQAVLANARQPLTSLSPKPSSARHKPTVPAPMPAADEQVPQLPSDQSQTRAWLQDAARQEPVPDERTLQMQMRESKRLQDEKTSSLLQPDSPQSHDAHNGEKLRVADDAPTVLPAVASSQR